MGKLSDNIKKYRKKQNLSQTELANKLYVTKQAISKWETGRGYPETSIIPQIAKELGVSIDVLMGQKFFTKKRIFMMVISLIFIMLMMIMAMISIRFFEQRKIYSDFTDHLEEVIQIDLPNNGMLEYSNYENWMEYGNLITVSQMSYLVFNRRYQIEEFESVLENDVRWMTSITDEELIYIPTILYPYQDKGDYFLIYNIENNSYNQQSPSNQMSEYILLIYQKDNNRLLIFDYFI